ncbi:sulfotransferase 1C4-like [Prorops nasuta]|uniref:sulfotransferase 1C4-like n=1 Tax=Prorops nasuta TaxID=863751 RepID=UPI0034CDBBA7
MSSKEDDRENGSDSQLSRVDDTEISKMYNGIYCIEKNGIKWVMPSAYSEISEYISNFKTKPDDTYIVTFPRSGTTWTQELIWLVANDLNFELATSKSLTRRFPYIEQNVVVGRKHISKYINELTNNVLLKEEDAAKNWTNYIDALPSPRFLKTHLAILLSKFVENNCKAIYVARNPKDMLVSYYHFHKAFKPFNCKMNFTQFAEYFMADLTFYCPLVEHLKIGWEHRNKPNVLFLFYEDLKKDLLGCVKRVCKFYGKTYSDVDLERLVEHLEFRNFHNNPMVNLSKPKDDDTSTLAPRSFIRKGQIGSWKEEFSPDLVTKFDRWLAEKLTGTDIVLPN